MRHHYACNCRECVSAQLWRDAIVCVIGAVLGVAALVAISKAGLFAWLTN